MHKPYEASFNRPADFRVRYRFYTVEEGGRWQLPFQGIRLNFWYESQFHPKKQLFMIWPEFEDQDGLVIVEGEVLPAGTARMWIINPDWRAYHQEKIQTGTQGYFLKGNRPVAVCEVIELLGLGI